MKRKFEGSGMLPGVDEEDSKPVSPPRIRAAPPPKREVPTWRIVVAVSSLIAFGLAALLVFHTFEQFLIRDARFALNGPEGDRETLDVSGAAHASIRQIEAVFSEDSGKS